MDDGYDLVNLARCRDLMEGRPLAELPEAALSLPGSRSRSAPAREPGDEDEGPKRSGRHRAEPPSAGEARASGQ
jgi:hypothetical protein